MRSPQITQGQLEKAASGWFTGCNTIRNPWILDEASYAYGVNVVNRGGIVQTRPGYKIALTLPPGNLQGSAIMTINKQDQNGNVYEGGKQFLIFAVQGLVYAAPFPLVQPKKITDWTQYQLTNLAFDPEAVRVYFCVAQKSLSTVGANIELNQTYNVLVMQDGITAAAFWDGNLNEHVNQNAPDSSVPTGTWMAFSGNRIWIARGNALIAGDLLDPLSFKERISGSTQGDFLLPDTITGLVNTVGYTFQPNLIAFTQDQTFSFLSNISNRETWSKTANFETILYPALGCVAGLSIVNHAGMLWWYSKGGLTNFNSATTAYLTSRVKYMDNEMANWTAEMYQEQSGICSASYGSYMLVSIPSNDVFNAKTMVMDYSVADELSSVAPPAWQGVWTGTRPVNWITAKINDTGANKCYQASVDYEPLNGSHNHIWEAFQSDRFDSYDYLDASNAVQTAHNPIYCGFETKLLGDGLDLKEFLFFYANLMEIAGTVNFRGSYRGTRGSYKELLNLKLIAITEAWQTNNEEIQALLKAGTVLVPQTRRLLSQVAQTQNLEQAQSVEDPNDETIDRCFSLYMQWCGHCAVESVMIVTAPHPENPTGQDESDEDTLNIVKQDGTSQAYNQGTLSTVTTVAPAMTGPTFDNNLFNRPFTPRFIDTYYSSIPPVKPANLIAGQCITCLPCARDAYPPVTFDPTSNDEGPGYGPVQYIGNTPQAYTATCPAGTVGSSVTVNIEKDTFFALTVNAANQIAYNYAVTKANSEIVCTVPPPVVSNGTLSLSSGQAVSYQIVATNNPTGYGATGLPAGLTLNATTGLITGAINNYTGSTQNYTVGLSATNAGGTGMGTLAISLTSLPTATFQFSNSIAIGGGNPLPFAGAVSIILNGGSPQAVTFDAITGLSPVYTAAKSLVFSLQLNNGVIVNANSEETLLELNFLSSQLGFPSNLITGSKIQYSGNISVNPVDTGFDCFLDTLGPQNATVNIGPFNGTVDLTGGTFAQALYNIDDSNGQDVTMNSTGATFTLNFQ